MDNATHYPLIRVNAYEVVRVAIVGSAPGEAAILQVNVDDDKSGAISTFIDVYKDGNLVKLSVDSTNPMDIAGPGLFRFAPETTFVDGTTFVEIGRWVTNAN